MSPHPILVSLVLTTVVLPPVPAIAALDAPIDPHTYLEDPQRTGEGQEPHHAILRPFADGAAAGEDREPRRRTPAHSRAPGGSRTLIGPPMLPTSPSQTTGRR